MRILLVTTQVPFVRGGAEVQVAGLRRVLESRGHQVEELPLICRFGPEWDRSVRTMLTARSLDVERVVGPVDLVVAMKFPGWLIRHPNKIVWLIHQERMVYDLWMNGLRNFPDGVSVRRIVAAADRLGLGEARHIFSISHNVAGRLAASVGLESTILRPPIDEERFVPGDEYEPFFLMPGRLAPLKRHELVIDALQHCSEKLVIVGRTEQPDYTERLRRRAREAGVDHRIVWRFDADDEAVLELYRRARAVVFVPVDEDYGLIAPEAMSCARAVITCRDSGGPLELVEEGKSGLIVEAEPSALGAAMDRLGEDRALAIRLGRQGRASYLARGISWCSVARQLLAEAGDSGAKEGVVRVRSSRLSKSTALSLRGSVESI